MTAWAARVPEPEGPWLAGPGNPLASLPEGLMPGSIGWDAEAGELQLDEWALRTLYRMDYRAAAFVTYDVHDRPWLHVGREAYRLEEVSAPAAQIPLPGGSKPGH